RRRRLEKAPAGRGAPPPGGYQWWYVDAMSADGRSSVTLIGFVGSVFSPYYAWAGRRDPLDHCALNVCLYGPGWSRWAMTERGRGEVARAEHGIQIGASRIAWERDRLIVDIEERATPHLGRISGRVAVRPRALSETAFALDAEGRHLWRPIAPTAAVDVAMSRPDFAWSGAGYLDMNWGAEPLEEGFALWDWARAPLADGSAAILYDALPRRGPPLRMALRARTDGSLERAEPPPPRPLSRTLWRIARRMGADAGAPAPREIRRLEDAPFYARDEAAARLFGEETRAMRETFDGDRFRQAWVKALLPVRMPRLRGRRR
ncbi:MAG: carotenoid 1,2-hydratase, partial [Pseudomonadota bacterium]